MSAIGSAGPRNVAEISRITHVHPETVRYKIKRRFGRLGFKFHAEVDFEKLGLSVHWGTMKFSKDYHPVATRILRSLNEVGYLTGFSKIVPQGYFATEFVLPEGATHECVNLLSRLRERRILSDFSLDEVVASRHKTMDARFFNFGSGRWEIEWDKIKSLAFTPLTQQKKKTSAIFDYQDLLIIKELQLDARQHLTSIAKKLKLHQKALEYHYRMHVQGRKLIPSYRIRWTQDTTKKLVHSVATTRWTFQGLTESEFTKVQSTVNKIPFLWSENLLQNGSYIATMYVPSSDIIQVSNYLDDGVSDMGAKMEMGFVRPSDSTSFTIPYYMYHKGQWKFEVEEAESTLRKTSSVSIQK